MLLRLAAFLVTQMFPGVVMLIPLYILLDTLHLLDSLVGLVLVYSTTIVPFSVFTLKGYFDTIPRELEEAALLDGASRWTTVTKIILPLARPALAVTGLFSFMTGWNEFILAATLLGDGQVTLALGHTAGSMPGRMIPAFVTCPEEAEALLWNEGCATNLATYLTRVVSRGEKVAVMPDQRTDCPKCGGRICFTGDECLSCGARLDEGELVG